ncbi:acyl carrier protein [Verrucomicrobiota bacterium]
MTQEEIIEKLREMMKQSSQADVKWDTVTENSPIESLGFDSLSILDLIYDIQQELGIEFEAEEMVSIRTIGELATFLQSKS